MKYAIVLCSGGLDSVVAAYYAKKQYNNLTLLFFNYNQNSLNQERQAVKYFAKKLNSKLIEIKVPNLNLSSSLLSKSSQSKVKNLKNTIKESEKFYVPQRNLIFLSIATAIGESLSIKEKSHVSLFVGFKNDGKEFFPDATPQFVNNFNKLIKSSTKNKVSLKAPLIKKDKEDIIKLGKSLKVKLEKTFSCYSPKNSRHCGVCLACKLRKAGFYWANEIDHTNYNSK